MPKQEFTLTDYIEGLSTLLRDMGIGKVWVKAEISSLTARPKGYYSVGLTDDVKGKKTANVSAIMWGKEAREILEKFQNATGKPLSTTMKVLVRVSAQLSPLWGFSLTIDDIDPSWTTGEEQAKLKAIRNSLTAIWNQNKILTTPDDFTRVAVLAPNGAGMEDFLKEAQKLQFYSLCNFDVFQATFEGPNASQSIINAMLDIKNKHIDTPYDCLAIVRGGGASSALDWLNDISIIESICRFPIPVLVGVGHERDVNLIDEVANISLGTPSKLIAWIEATIMIKAQIADKNFQDVTKILDAKLERLELNLEKLKENGYLYADGLLLKASSTVDDLMREGVGLGPYRTMTRGYTVVTNLDGKVITSVEQVTDIEEAETLRVSFHNGSILVKNLGEEVYE